MTIRIRAAAVLLACVVAGACSDGDIPRPNDSPTSEGSAVPLTPEQALELGGLKLPAEHADLTYDIVDVPQNRETYVVTFHTAREDAIAICSTAGLGGDLPALKLNDDDRAVFGGAANAGDGARYCSSMWPESTSWSRTVLVEPGDPALVRIAVARQAR